MPFGIFFFFLPILLPVVKNTKVEPFMLTWQRVPQVVSLSSKFPVSRLQRHWPAGYDSLRHQRSDQRSVGILFLTYFLPQRHTPSPTSSGSAAMAEPKDVKIKGHDHPHKLKSRQVGKDKYAHFYPPFSLPLASSHLACVAYGSPALRRTGTMTPGWKANRPWALARA